MGRRRKPRRPWSKARKTFSARPRWRRGQGEAEVKNLAEALDQRAAGAFGNLEASGSYLLTREFLRGEKGQEDNELGLLVQGDFLLDARLKKGFRAFLDLGIGTVVGQPTALIGLKEVFIDFNAANAVYFRAGKQVLQWGRGYLWNPTDLINVERKSFTDLEALRDGVFGLRADVVFARAFHLYTFFDLNEVADLSDIAVAARAEFLLGSVEFAFSGWGKPGEIPVFGFDLSAPLFWSLSFHGEGTLSWGYPVDKMTSRRIAGPGSGPAGAADFRRPEPVLRSRGHPGPHRGQHRVLLQRPGLRGEYVRGA